MTNKVGSEIKRYSCGDAGSLDYKHIIFSNPARTFKINWWVVLNCFLYVSCLGMLATLLVYAFFS